MTFSPEVIKLTKLAVRLLCLGAFFYKAFTFPISWQTVALLLLFIGSIYFLRSSKVEVVIDDKQKEPKTKDILDELYPLIGENDLDIKVSKEVCDFVTYDAENVEAIYRFEQIKQNTECIFSKNAKIWASKDWDYSVTLEANIYRMLPTFLKFTLLCRQKRIDGFVIELPGEEFGTDIKSFGSGVRRVLKVLSDNDPAGFKCMDKSYAGKKGWVFEFNKWTFFITTFAPFYPSNHSRHAFGCDNCYILMQPEISFALRDLPTDTPETNWENPVTVRDKIRIAYKNAGREYNMKQTYFNPMAWDIVKPVDTEDSVVKWWEK